MKSVLRSFALVSGFERPRLARSGAPAVAHRIQRLGLEPRPMMPEEFTAFLRADSARWEEIIRRS